MFYLDECGFANLPNVQRSWSPKGRPHEAEAGVSRKRVNVVGALDYPTGRLWHEVHDATVRRGNVADLIERIARREDRKTLTLVVLMHLPPYSPELNLIEILWKHAKYHWGRFVTRAKDQVREEVAKLMQGFGSAYKISFA